MPESSTEACETFDSMDLDARLLRAIAKMGYKQPTLIQQTAIPLAISGKDIVAKARTGSGKTAAFCLPILNKILALETNAIRALILVPSKELAAQVYSFLMQVTCFCQKEARIYNACESTALMQTENPHIIVSTPTKYLQLVQSQDTLESLVIDEADLILSFGYEDDMNQIAELLPKVFQGFLFSATLSCDVDKLKLLLVRNPAIIKLEHGDDQDLLMQYSIKCSDHEKFLLTYFMLKLKVHPFGTGKTIIFVNDIDRGYRLKLFLEQFGVKSCILNSELPFKSRHHIVQEFNRGLYDYLIATDEIRKDDAKEPKAPVKKTAKKSKVDAEFGVARGIDFINVQTVINFDIPGNLRGYLHRIGRTARGVGNKGYSLSFVEVKPFVAGDNTTKIEAPTREQTAFEKIKRKLEKVGREIEPFTLDMTQVDGFRYRVEDALRLVTRVSVREARLKEIKSELLNSEKLKAHFEDNPRDLEALRHDKPIHPTKVQGHLKHVPLYLLPTTNRGILSAEEVMMGEVRFDSSKQSKRKRKGGHKNRRNVDTLKSFAI